MKVLLIALLSLPLYGMYTPSSPQSPKKPSTPKELATAISLKVFEREDDEVISAFTRILLKDKKGNTALLEMRYRVLERLEFERLACTKQQH